MSLPGWHRALSKMAENALLQTKTTQDIARKAGLEPGTSVGAGPPDIWGTFTLIETSNLLGYTETFALNASRFLPEGLPQMDRFADWSNASEARLLLTVTQAGVAGSKIGITSDEATFNLSVPLSATGLQVSAWTAVSKSQEAIVNSWMVENPNLLTGSFGIGLCQLQAR